MVRMPLEQAELVERARSGDDAAFEELVRTTHADTYTLAYRLTGDADDAQDVVQDAYLRAFRGIRRFRGDAQFSTWLYRITANCASTVLTRRAKARHDDLPDDAAIAEPRPEADPELMADADDFRRQLQEALLQLPPALRSVVVLRDVYDLPHEAIASELGISEAAAKVRLHRARKKLRDGLFADRGEEASRAG